MKISLVNTTFVIGFFWMVTVSAENLAGTTVNQNAPYIAILITTIVTLILILILNPHSFPAKLKINSRNGTEKSIEVILVQYLAIGWVFILLAWYFAAFNSILSGTNPAYVFRNFFGLLVYGLVPIACLQRLSLRYVFIALIVSGVYQFVITLSYIPQMSLANVVLSLSGYRVLHNPALIILYPLLAVATAFCFYPRSYFSDEREIFLFKFLNYKIALILLLIVIIVPSASKGHLLTCGIIVFSIWLMAIIDQLRRNKIKLFLFTLLLLSTFVYLLPATFISQLLYTFSNEEASNIRRATQSTYLIKEFSFFGAGLGAPLQSGYVRDSTGYGFELTYLNIIHKLGIFSVALFGYYIGTIMLLVNRIYNRKFLLGAFVSTGLMGYLIMGAGNPVLLSPLSVSLHSLAVYILVFPNR